MSRRRIGLAAAMLTLAVATAILPGCSLVGGAGGGFALRADFARGTGLYPGSPVRILGIDIGRVSAVKNRNGTVRVDMAIHDGVKIPADATATIIPLTLLGERYVQLGPSWTSGPRLGDGDEIPLDRTRVPAEFDDLLRGLQDFIGKIDPKRASNVVTDLATVLDGRGNALNDLIANGSGTLGLLADKGEQLQDIIRSLGEITQTLKGRTQNIEALIRNYNLVAQVLIDNKSNLDATITEFDRATQELTGLLTRNADPLRDDVAVLAKTGRTLDANTGELTDTLRSTVRLFAAAQRAYDQPTNSLAINNQAAPDVTSALLAGRLRDRIAGLCRRLGIDLCRDPASPLLNDLASSLPSLLRKLQDGSAGMGTPSPPGTPTVPAFPALPAAPNPDALVNALASQLTAGLGPEQAKLLASLDADKLARLLSLDPTLLQVLSELNTSQLTQLRQVPTDRLQEALMALTNALHPPASRLDPILPGGSGSTPPGSTLPPVTVTLPGTIDTVLNGLLGGK